MEKNDKERLEYFRDGFVNPSPQEMDELFALYRKYLNPHVYHYQTGCDCGNSIIRFYKDLMEWFKNEPQ